MSRQVDLHIAVQARLRKAVAAGVAAAWTALPAYYEADVPVFLRTAVPIVLAGQRQSAAITDAYIARALERQPLGIDPSLVTGAAARNGVDPLEVYRRPFVTVWTALKTGSDYRDAVDAGLARAVTMAASDVQLAARATFQQIQEQDQSIYGYARTADPDACEFCQLVDGAYVKSADAMPLHNNCGCSLEPLTSPHPRAAVLPSGVAVHEHGELGPVLADPAQTFTTV